MKTISLKLMFMFLLILTTSQGFSKQEERPVYFSDNVLKVIQENVAQWKLPYPTTYRMSQYKILAAELQKIPGMNIQYPVGKYTFDRTPNFMDEDSFLRIRMADGKTVQYFIDKPNPKNANIYKAVIFDKNNKATKGAEFGEKQTQNVAPANLNVLLKINSDLEAVERQIKYCRLTTAKAFNAMIEATKQLCIDKKSKKQVSKELHKILSSNEIKALPKDVSNTSGYFDCSEIENRDTVSNQESADYLFSVNVAENETLKVEIKRGSVHDPNGFFVTTPRTCLESDLQAFRSHKISLQQQRQNYYKRNQQSDRSGHQKVN